MASHIVLTYLLVLNTLVAEHSNDVKGKNVLCGPHCMYTMLAAFIDSAASACFLFRMHGLVVYNYTCKQNKIHARDPLTDKIISEWPYCKNSIWYGLHDTFVLTIPLRKKYVKETSNSTIYNFRIDSSYNYRKPFAINFVASI